jgi:hypothetical protein
MRTGCRLWCSVGVMMAVTAVDSRVGSVTSLCLSGLVWFCLILSCLVLSDLLCSPYHEWLGEGAADQDPPAPTPSSALRRGAREMRGGSGSQEARRGGVGRAWEGCLALALAPLPTTVFQCSLHALRQRNSRFFYVSPVVIAWTLVVAGRLKELYGEMLGGSRRLFPSGWWS